MPKQPKLPPELESTLSRRVAQLREMRNMTVLDLARVCRFTVRRIEDIEAGIELWLSFTDRTILSRALGVPAVTLKEVEGCPSDLTGAPLATEATEKPDLDELAECVLAGEVNLKCPRCGEILKSHIENALDLEGNPTQFARAYCPICPFSLR